MLWINSKRVQWQKACSKSLLVMFIAQLLLSATCVSTANASSTHLDVASTSVAAHCHQHMQTMNTSHHSMPPCGHCDTSGMGLSAQVVHHVDMVPVLLAVIALPEFSEYSNAAMTAQIEYTSPPNSASLLYQTSQRILI